MRQALILFLITFLIVLACIIFLAISTLLTGKSRLKLGMCGKVPAKKSQLKNGDETEQVCPICETKKVNEKNDDKEHPLSKRDT